MSSSRLNHCGRLANGNSARPTVEAEGSSPFLFGKFPLHKHFHYRGQSFATIAKNLSLHQLCSSKIKTKIKELKILKKILIKN